MLLLREKIKEAGLKATPQRLAIYESMRKLGHASVDMVIEDLKNSFPTLTVATIYNVLESFVNTGLLTRRFSSNNKMYFDVNTFKHMHLYDQENHVFKDVIDDELIALIESHLGRKKFRGYKIEGIDIQLVGRPTKKKYSA